MSDPTARLRINRDGDRLVVDGDIDAHTCPDLAAHLDPLTGDGDVQVDLAGVDFMDSSGLRVIIGAHQRAAEADRKLIIERPGRAVRRILEISGLIDHLHIVDAD